MAETPARNETKEDKMQTMTPTQKPAAGSRFTKVTRNRYRVADGSYRHHEFVLLCEVVAVDARGFEYAVVEVLEESGRPEGFPTRQAPTRGEMAWFGWDAAVSRGDVRPVEVA